MLYVTTRNNRTLYTPAEVLGEDRGLDGGFFVPQQLPRLDRRRVASFGSRSFNAALTEILSLLLDREISAFDMDFSLGRSTARLTGLPHRIWVGECWHNLDSDFQRSVGNLWQLVGDGIRGPIPEWFRVATGIGVIFGLFGKLMRKDAAGPDTEFDIAVPSGDFTWPMAAWYAREMGLPIANIILCCNENNNPWELLHHGALRGNLTQAETDTPLCDQLIPEGMERFVHACGGSREVERYLMAVDEGRMYISSDTVLEAMRRGVHACVAGRARVRSAIPNVYRSHGEILERYTALTYSGLMDYRAGGAESRPALVLSLRGPGADMEFTARAMGMDTAALVAAMDR